ncbi:hypothetical protein FOA43_001912 [Brettanomyces nanus]|uniref:K Homology domain-containing protein n=1 Tax=Eeniella nana TaxID=13502 RepID=A0A875RYH6_EENNA|nr:uncharacterized protein FOA43_001912 [Brettanomyces nanus]QPG74581.1 hypothetical protein FOA43_001912 [Brettanomyces nanus]
MPQMPNNKSSSINEKLIITIPLGYTFFIKPSETIFEALIQSDWQSKGPEAVSTIPTIQNQLFQQLSPKALIFDNLPPLRQVVTSVNENYAQYGIITILNEFRISDLKLTASIIGSCSVQKQIHDIRLMILKSFSPIIKVNIDVSASGKHRRCFKNSDNSEITTEFADYLREVSLFTGTSIYVIKSDDASSGNCQISIVGSRDQVKSSENKIRLKMDDLNPLLFSDFLELTSLSLLPLISGPELASMKRIIQQTHCSIYLPNLLPNLYYAKQETNSPPRIYITGLRALVLQAKNAIAAIISKTSTNPFMKQLAVMPLKREMLILQRAKEIKSGESLSADNSSAFDQLMYSTGCYIEISPLGYGKESTTSDIVTFQGNSIEDVDSAIDRFVEMLSGLYSAKSEFIISNDMRNGEKQMDINRFLNFCDTLASNSDVAVSCSKYGSSYVVQTLGSPQSTRLATNYSSQLGPYFNEEIKKTSVQFQIELPNQERDFIAGKKNGKLVKIANTSSVSVQLLPFTDHNFLVELSGETLGDAVLGLELLEEEMPKSITFNVPESFHRQIIGVGGQTVQTIMRKYNVFIKFSNSFEMGDKPLDRQHAGQAANFRQGFIRKKNVIIKCPAKNRTQIPLARLELERLVEKVAHNNYKCCVVSFNSSQWVLLTGEKLNDLFNKNKKKPTNFITELEKHTNTYIKFPGPDCERPTAKSVIVSIYGSESSPRIACNELKKLLPYCYEVRLRKSVKFDRLEAVTSNVAELVDGSRPLDKVQQEFLNNVVVPFRMLFSSELFLMSSKDEQYDSIFINYYPMTFGYQFTSMRAERLSTEGQSQIIQSDSFQQLLSSLKQFLKDCRFEIIEEQIKQVNLIFESHERQGKENLSKDLQGKQPHLQQKQHNRHGNQDRNARNQPNDNIGRTEDVSSPLGLASLSMPNGAYGGAATYHYQTNMMDGNPYLQQGPIQPQQPQDNAGAFKYPRYRNANWE